MGVDLAELLGIVAVIVGACLVVAAATFVSIALACLVGGVFLILGGGVAAYTAARIDAARRSTAEVRR